MVTWKELKVHSSPVVQKLGFIAGYRGLVKLGGLWQLVPLKMEHENPINCQMSSRFQPQSSHTARKCDNHFTGWPWWGRAIKRSNQCSLVIIIYDDEYQTNISPCNLTIFIQFIHIILITKVLVLKRNKHIIIIMVVF